jgi:hypothetical protein
MPDPWGRSHATDLRYMAVSLGRHDGKIDLA